MKRTGFSLLETTFGMALAVMITAALAVAASQNRQAMNQLGHRRIALRAAEQVLDAMQQGTREKAAIEQTTGGQTGGDQTGNNQRQLIISLKALPDSKSPDGHIWVQVTAQYRFQTGQLIGLVPLDLLEPPKP